MKLSELKLLPGSAIQLEFVDSARERYITRVIGYTSGQSIIVLTPRSKGNLILARLRQKVNVRLFSNTTVCAFQSEILSICTAPYGYMHLSYPPRMFADSVRKARRVSVELPTSVVFQSEVNSRVKIQGRILDLSIDGARLAVPMEVGVPGTKVSLVTKVPVGNVTRIVTLQAIIRVKLDQKPELEEEGFSHEYGIEFVNMSDEYYVILYAFVYSQIVENDSDGPPIVKSNK